MTPSAAQPRPAPLWVLVLAALLIGPGLVLGVAAAEDEGNRLRALLPADPGRRWIEPPFLTWHQGRTQ